MYERFIKVFNAREAKGYYKNKGRTEGAMHDEKSVSRARVIIVLIGFPLIFLIMALVTGEWRYMTWMIPPALMSCWTALFVLRKQEER